MLRIQQGALQIRSSLGNAKPTLDFINHLHALTPLDIYEAANRRDNFTPQISINSLSYSYPGSKKLAIGGSKSTVNALSETNGPSWRMVIELGKNPKGHGVYPGGQSGNPGSQFYDNMIDTWAEGKLYELIYLQSVTEKSDKIISHYKISKK
jgi:hypothetical protein